MPQWNATGAFVNFPFASPYPPLVLRAAEGPDPDKILVVSDVSGGSYTFSAYDVASGASGRQRPSALGSKTLPGQPLKSAARPG